jgi:hydroxyacylglutathione hydrolase
MLLRHFYDTKLAQASYLVGCQRTGEAIVIDPHRDVEQYIKAAEAEGLRITHVTETHIHADFVSGVRELAAHTGATIHLSDEGDAAWKYGYADNGGAVLVHDGDVIKVGNIELQVMHTPGHTPEHISFLLTDRPATPRPMGVFTGDFVFVGDVGRPDLLERAAGSSGTMAASASALHRSLQSFKRFPDYLQLWPGHGAGSACGKALGAVPSTTLGYERIANWAFSMDDEAEFVRAVLDGQPEPPTYFAQMKRINKEGPPVLGGFTVPPRLDVNRLRALAASGALIVDARAGTAFAAGHVPKTLSIPHGKSFITWAGWLVPHTEDFYLILDDTSGQRVLNAVRDLAMVGLDRIAGWFGGDTVAEWAASTGESLETVAQIAPTDAASRAWHGDVRIVDVRGKNEWDEGHIAGAVHIPLGHLRARADELPKDRPLVLQCATGNRSGTAASILQSLGMTDLFNLEGGIAAWEHAGLAVER